ncbi:unnamed protein product [Phytomonas sp. EM1]|nr:unnamed protein product [Phytomonas sp. EM1]|eukprot:CCW65492.1 unnamed protein product [Phytomonas sp. isolate EM1]
MEVKAKDETPLRSTEDEDLCAMFRNLLSGGLTTADDLKDFGFSREEVEQFLEGVSPPSSSPLAFNPSTSAGFHLSHSQSSLPRGGSASGSLEVNDGTASTRKRSPPNDDPSLVALAAGELQPPPPPFTRPVSEAGRSAFNRDVAQAEITRVKLQRSSERLHRASLYFLRAQESREKDSSTTFQSTCGAGDAGNADSPPCKANGKEPQATGKVDDGVPVSGEIPSELPRAVLTTNAKELSEDGLNTALRVTGSDIMVGKEIALLLQQKDTMEECDECLDDFYARRQHMCNEKFAGHS